MTHAPKSPSLFTRVALLLGVLTTVLLCPTVTAQGFITGQAIAPSGKPAAFAQVRVCPYVGGGGLPCNPLSSIYSDVALTQPVPNPYTSDQFGNFSVAAASGNYIVQVSIPGVSTIYSYLYTVGAGESGISLTTNGSSGPATLISNALNIPVYSSGGGSCSGTAGFFPLFTNGGCEDSPMTYGLVNTYNTITLPTDALFTGSGATNLAGPNWTFNGVNPHQDPRTFEGSGDLQYYTVSIDSLQQAIVDDNGANETAEFGSLNFGIFQSRSPGWDDGSPSGAPGTNYGALWFLPSTIHGGVSDYSAGISSLFDFPNILYSKPGDINIEDELVSWVNGRIAGSDQGASLKQWITAEMGEWAATVNVGGTGVTSLTFKSPFFFPGDQSLEKPLIDLTTAATGCTLSGFGSQAINAGTTHPTNVTTATISGSGCTFSSSTAGVLESPTYTITSSSVSGGIATFGYTFSTGASAPPQAGQTFIISGTTNASGALNSTNATIVTGGSGSSGTFTVATSVGNTSMASESGLGTDVVTAVSVPRTPANLTLQLSQATQTVNVVISSLPTSGTLPVCYLAGPLQVDIVHPTAISLVSTGIYAVTGRFFHSHEGQASIFCGGGAAQFLEQPTFSNSATGNRYVLDIVATPGGSTVWLASQNQTGVSDKNFVQNDPAATVYHGAYVVGVIDPSNGQPDDNYLALMDNNTVWSPNAQTLMPNYMAAAYHSIFATDAENNPFAERNLILWGWSGVGGGLDPRSGYLEFDNNVGGNNYIGLGGKFYAPAVLQAYGNISSGMILQESPLNQSSNIGSTGCRSGAAVGVCNMSPGTSSFTWLEGPNAAHSTSLTFTIGTSSIPPVWDFSTAGTQPNIVRFNTLELQPTLYLATVDTAPFNMACLGDTLNANGLVNCNAKLGVGGLVISDDSGVLPATLDFVGGGDPYTPSFSLQRDGTAINCANGCTGYELNGVPIGGSISGSGTKGFFSCFTGASAIGNCPADANVTSADTITFAEGVAGPFTTTFENNTSGSSSYTLFNILSHSGGGIQIYQFDAAYPTLGNSASFVTVASDTGGMVFGTVAGPLSILAGNTTALTISGSTQIATFVNPVIAPAFQGGSSGATAALPSGAHGITGDTSATAGIPAANVDYIRWTNACAELSVNTGAETCIATSIFGTTGTITGTSLTASCDSGTATVTGAVVGRPVSVSSTTGVDVGGAFTLRASVTSSNTVSVYICGTGTPSSLAYNVEVF